MIQASRKAQLESTAFEVQVGGFLSCLFASEQETSVLLGDAAEYDVSDRVGERERVDLVAKFSREQ